MFYVLTLSINWYLYKHLVFSKQNKDGNKMLVKVCTTMIWECSTHKTIMLTLLLLLAELGKSTHRSAPLLGADFQIASTKNKENKAE